MSRRYLHPGPIDSSLLTFQVHHLSESVWANREYNSLLHCAHYASAACRNVVSNDRIDRLLREAGFLAITRLGYMKLDHHLITALVERWRPEVHAFHLPLGEVTIILQDVEVLLGLKVDGRPVIGKIDQSNLVRFTQIENLLGFTPNQDDFNTTVLKITSLEAHVAAFDMGVANDEQCEQYVALSTLMACKAATSNHTYTTYRDELDRCRVDNFVWMSYHIDALPEFSRDGQHIWTARVPLLYFFAVEWHYPDRVCRQFEGYQEILASVEYDHQLHKYDGRQRSEQWDIFHYEFVQMWEQRNERVTTIARHTPLGPFVSPLYDHWFYRYGRRLIGNLNHHQSEGYLQTAPSYIATVEALRHISIAGDIAEERGESNDFTHVMQNIARDELVRLRYGYVLEFPRNYQEFMYEDSSTDVNIEEDFDHNADPNVDNNDFGGTNSMGDVTQLHLSQPVDEDIQLARAVERTVTYPPGEFIVFSTTESESGPSNTTESESWPSSKASQDTSTRSKSESSTAFSTNKKK
nr:serine/threonine-protein phosphatase 7 long form homolog [Ipomoea batatas]